MARSRSQHLWRHFAEAIANILSARLRSLLAMLGIVVGSAAVVALMTSAQLASLHAAAQFKTLGTNLVAVDLSYPSQHHAQQQANEGLPLASVDKLKSRVANIQVVAPYIFLFQTSRYRGQAFSGPVIGTTQDFLLAAKLPIAQGRFINRLDRTKPFCVIGADIAAELKKKGLRNPVGEQLLVGDQFFTIVGVAKTVPPNLFIYLDINQAVMIPLDAAYFLAKVTGISNLIIRLNPTAPLSLAEENIKHFLQEQVPGAEINLRDPQQILAIMQKQQQTFNLLLVVIGAISLLVGGMGVMNIMLILVVERRREIGIRLAVGANKADILQMFLIEAIVLTVTGGFLGVFLGEGISGLWAYFSDWQFYWLAWPLILSMSLTLLIGISAGFYPALRASRLDPIQSLRAD